MERVNRSTMPVNIRIIVEHALKKIRERKVCLNLIKKLKLVTE